LNFESQKFVLLGGSGILGKGLSKRFNEKVILETSRSEIDSWLGSSGLTKMSQYFASLGTNVTVINALGLTDPKAPFQQLELLNSTLPMRIRESIDNLGHKLITFGSILENNLSLASVNPYIRAKRNFLESIEDHPSNKDHLHLQLHTIYGGERSHPHMFIEQIYRSLSANSEFEMSSGLQIREYHHIDDEVNAIAIFATTELSGVFQLNSGNAIQIKHLATSIFEEFEKLSLLKFNSALDGIDVYENCYKKSPFLDEVQFRDPILGVTEYLKSHLTSN
jgi:hypothetical protein